MFRDGCPGARPGGHCRPVRSTSWGDDMELFRRAVVVGFAVALLGVVVASLVVPNSLGLLYDAAGTRQCNCLEVAQTTANRLLVGQLIGGGVGFVVGVAGAVTLAVRRRRKQAAEA